MDSVNDTNIDIWQQLSQPLRAPEGGLKQQLENIQKNTVKTQSQLNERENMLSPIGVLPTETLSLIFLFVVEFVPGDLHATPFPMPLTLASVCRRWRSIVLANPRLWTHISLEHFHCNRGTSSLEPYLSRSAGLMLDISLVGARYKGTGTLLCALGNEAHRWRRLQVDVTNASDNHHLYPFWFQKRAESLTYISLVNKQGPISPLKPDFSIHQNNLHTLILIHVHLFVGLVPPNLQHFTFVGPTSGSDFRHDWHQLSSDSLWHTLSPTKNLLTLRLGLDSIVFGNKTKILLLAQLRHFTIFLQSGSFQTQDGKLKKLLDMISVPALETIEFTNADNSAYIFIPERGDFWKKLMNGGKPRFATVTTAILYQVSSRTEDIRWFMEAFPNITNLTLDIRTLELCNNFLKKGDNSKLLRCWDRLECTRVYQTFCRGYVSSRILQEWCRRRRELGLPPTGLRVHFSLSSIRAGSGCVSEREELVAGGLIRFVKCHDDEVPWNLHWYNLF